MSIFILQGLALGFAAAVQPGPFLAYLVSQTLSKGFRKTWMAAFAPLLSDGPIICLALLVLSNMPDWLQRGLNLLSGSFILYLAWSAFQQWRRFQPIDQLTGSAAQHGLFKAAFMNIINPMPYIYWSLVTGPILISGWRANPAYGLGFILTFYLVMIMALLAIMAVFGAARTLGSQVSRGLLGLSAAALAVFGLLQLYQAWIG